MDHPPRSHSKAYYSDTISAFLLADPATIVGTLTKHSFDINTDQTDAWFFQIHVLQKVLPPCALDGHILFEYDIVRLGKRIDVVLLVNNIVFSLEFKNGKTTFESKDAQQAEDYATDIKNFHKASKDLYVCPILVATHARAYPKPQTIDHYEDKQLPLQRENLDTLGEKIRSIVARYGQPDSIDPQTWIDSPYHPTPSIIAAAIEVYLTHDTTQIANSEAGQDDIEKCQVQLAKVIEYAQANHKKCACFVTGVPGAGKTLVGLNVVAQNLKKGDEGLSVYLSGNGPLVKVLQKALEINIKQHQRSRRETPAAIKTLIQSSYAFKRDNAPRKDPTAEKVLIFDEAQRVWDAKKMAQKHDNDPIFSVSEPHLLYSIMDRHQDWAVMVCLVGLGQDIYNGEVGINEWFRCGIQEFTEWELFYSPEIFSQTEDKQIDQKMILACDRCKAVQNLHLNTSIRSFRAEKQALFVDALLDGDAQTATRMYQLIQQKYPVYITRDYTKAKSWISAQVRGSQRSGVLACSSAQRLKPEGIYVPTEIDYVNWFLAPSNDLRSSNMMEVVVKEFETQGLEIDHAVVCWDADLRWINDGWEHYSFRGSHWNRRNKPEQKRYLINAYRVLLTRARQSMVIFVPHGTDPEVDPTRDPRFYDHTYAYLRSCGIPELP